MATPIAFCRKSSLQLNAMWPYEVEHGGIPCQQNPRIVAHRPQTFLEKPEKDILRCQPIKQIHHTSAESCSIFLNTLRQSENILPYFPRPCSLLISEIPHQDGMHIPSDTKRHNTYMLTGHKEKGIPGKPLPKTPQNSSGCPTRTLKYGRPQHRRRE